MTFPSDAPLSSCLETCEYLTVSHSPLLGRLQALRVPNCNPHPTPKMKPSHLLIVLTFAAFLCSAANASAQSNEVARYTFDPPQGTSLPVSSSISDASVSASGFGKGGGFWDAATGVGTGVGAPPNCFYFIRSNRASEQAAFNAGTYLEFTVTPSVTTSFAELKFDYARGPSGVNSYAIYASSGIFTFATHRVKFGTLPSTGGNTIFTSTPLAVDLSDVPSLQNVTGPITFRIYLWGSGWASEGSRMDNVSLSVQPSIYEIGPDADATTRGGSHANTNFGNQTTLEVAPVWSAENQRHSYIRFPLGFANYDVASAQLKITPIGKGTGVSAGTTYKVMLVSDGTWTETGITFANRPKEFITLVQFTGADLTMNSTLTLNIPAAAVQQAKAWHGSITLAILPVTGTSSTLNITLASDEHADAAKRPTLVVETAPASPTTLYYGDLDPTKLPPAGWSNLQWQDPGNWQPPIDVTDAGLPANNPNVDASQKVRDILAANPTGNLKLIFPAGTYTFKSHLSLNRSNVVIEGAGMNSTTFNIDIPSAEVGGISFAGRGFKKPNDSWEPVVTVIGGAPLGASELMVSPSSAAGFNAAGHALVYSMRQNDAAMFRWDSENGWPDNYNYYYGQIVKISSVDYITGRIVLDQKLGLDYSIQPRIRRINMVENVGISKVKIHRVRDNADYSLNIGMSNVANGYITDVDSSWCANMHISIDRSRNIVIERNKIHEAWNYGDGGHGYGIQLQEHSTNIRVTDNKLWTLRHHIALQKGPSHCVVAYNSIEPIYKNGATVNGIFSAGDTICFHGFYPHNNLVEGNMFYDSYVDFVWGGAGPRNAWFRNRAEGIVGISVWAPLNDTTTRDQIIVGNIGSVIVNANPQYVGANITPSGYPETWGVFTSQPVLPPSLYLTGKPAFLSDAGKLWPLFGPEVSAWGNGKTIPAKDRSQ